MTKRYPASVQFWPGTVAGHLGPTWSISVRPGDVPIPKRHGWNPSAKPERYELKGGGARVPAGSVWCSGCGNVPVPPHVGMCKRCRARNAKKRKRGRDQAQRVERRNPAWQLPLDLT